MPTKPNAIPEGYHSVTPYMIVRDAARAIDFYKNALGATEIFRMEHGGKIGHAELQFGNSRVMLADEFPEMDAKGPLSLGGSPVSLLFYVEDVDTLALRAEKAGMKVIRPLKNQFYGDRSATFEDPFGHTWTISTHVEDVAPEEMDRRAKAMYGG